MGGDVDGNGDLLLPGVGAEEREDALTAKEQGIKNAKLRRISIDSE